MRIEQKVGLAITCTETPFAITFVPSAFPMHWIRIEETPGDCSPEDSVEVKLVTDEQRNHELNRARTLIEEAAKAGDEETAQ